MHQISIALFVGVRFEPHPVDYIIQDAARQDVVLQSLSRRTHQSFIAVGSLYNVLSRKLSNNSIRELIWNLFATSVDL